MAQPFFDAQHMPPPEDAYVAWFDVMGVQATMSRSLHVTANFVFKLHVAILEARSDAIVLYPVMDGVYVVSRHGESMRLFLKKAFSSLANLFVATQELHHCFVVKSALAFGPIVHGSSIPPECSGTLSMDNAYRNQLLLGMPMIQAFQGERKAPPFGVYVHESARAFAPPGEDVFKFIWWSWFHSEHSGLSRNLSHKLDEYFAWCDSRSGSIEYGRERIEAHWRMAREYFVDVREPCDDAGGAAATSS